jgi:hypothetical protein
MLCLLIAVALVVPSQDADMGVTEKGLRVAFREMYASPDESKRAEAVTTLSNASRELPDKGSSKLMARTLAGALDDDSPTVQSAAVSALAWGRHVETTIDAMSEILHEMNKLSAKLATRPDEESRTRRRLATRIYSQACVALGRHPDERSLDALVDELRKQRPRMGTNVASEEFVRPLSTALLELGSHKAVEHVVTTTNIFSGNVLRNNVSSGTAQALHGALSAFSEGIGYGPPAYSDTYDQSWRAWFKRYEDELPPSLGKLKEPVAAPEYRRPSRNQNRRRPGKRERP